MILSALPKLLPGIPVVADYYRMVAEKYRGELDETAHTVLYSWRYNPRGEFGALYLSVSASCAGSEKLRQVHGNPKILPEQVVGSFHVNVRRCLNLTDAGVLRKLDIEREDLVRPNDFSLTQDLSRQARRLGFEAIMAPSAVGAECRSLVVFKDRLLPGSSCLLDPASVRPYSF